LPVKNGQAYLQPCLDSLAAQTLSDFEIIALDHGSQDASPEILRAQAARDPRLQVISSSAASLPLLLNEGIAACQGGLIARMDADDICLPGRFEAQAALLSRRPELGLVGAKIEFFGDGLSEGSKNYESWINALDSPEAILRELFVECPLPHPSWMARRGVFERLGYLDDGLPEDYHFVLRAAEAGIGMAKPEGTLLKWRDHAQRHSRSHPRYARPAFMRLRARFLRRMLLKSGPCILWGAGDRGRLLARLLLEEGASIKSVVGWSPDGSQAASVHGIGVIPPEALPRELPCPLIACVGAPGVRGEIRAWAAGRGWIEGKDYWFAS
jgi:glycosyltransferase involved in cell wall biosynthesis